jgi:hypothetical protein
MLKKCTIKTGAHFFLHFRSQKITQQCFSIFSIVFPCKFKTFCSIFKIQIVFLVKKRKPWFFLFAKYWYMILSFSDKIPFQSETLITRRKKEWKDWIQSDKLQCQNADKASMLNNEFMYAPTLNNLYDNLLHNWCKSPPPPSKARAPHPTQAHKQILTFD